MDQLDPDDARPPYVKLAEAVRTVIDKGLLSPGDKLPTHSQLVTQYGVSLGTVKRALGLLQDEGLIVSRRGEGAFVRTCPQPRDASADGGEVAELRQAVEDLARRVDAVERRLGAQAPSAGSSDAD